MKIKFDEIIGKIKPMFHYIGEEVMLTSRKAESRSNFSRTKPSCFLLNSKTIPPSETESGIFLNSF